jgi:hypothetical protein
MLAQQPQVSPRKVATIDVVTIRDAELHVDGDCVQVYSSMLALETEKSCGMRLGVTCIGEFNHRPLIECLPQIGSRDPDLSSHIVRRQGDGRGVSSWSKGLSRVQGRVAVKP